MMKKDTFRIELHWKHYIKFVEMQYSVLKKTDSLLCYNLSFIAIKIGSRLKILMIRDLVLAIRE